MTETQNTNRLVNETSTYLLQHAHNPVDWYPWGSEALERSKLEQKPILLSIGYAACHWCHVMEHESFEDAETAALMNKLFVNVKVDREERTDLDEIYMKAVQMLTGHGGWPMTVFLTPELKPFYGGTYFPPNDRHGLPGFKKLLVGVNNAWTERKAEVIESASEITEALRSMDQLPMGDAGDHPAKSLDQSLIIDAAEKMLRTFDRQWGGFGSAPKFPHSFSISLAMRAALIAEGKGEKNLTKDFKELVKLTLDKMAFGGMQDQLGGGFARYSVDRKWLIPHFEKMLYDNALLCKTYLEGYAWTGSEYWRRVADELIGFVLRELKTEGGAFYSSLDADSEGEEGKFYVWTPSQIRQILGTESGGKDEDADFFCDVFGVTETGNFEHGTSALNLVKSPEELASKHGISVAQFWDRVDKLRVPLMEERDKRIRPGRDEKVLTSWNSLMISALVDGYRVLKKPEYLQAAKVATNFIFDNLMKDGRLLRTWGKGKAKLDGYMDDYAYFIQALLDLASVDFDPRWFNEAQRLTELSLELFWDETEATFFYTSSNHETLITRPKNQFDGSIPSPISVSISNLMRLSRLTHQEQYAKCAETLIHRYSELALKYPDQFSNLLCALDFTIQESVEIAIVKSKSQQAEELIFAAHEGFLPNRLVLVSDGELDPETAILRGRGTINGKPAAYLCQNYVCESPTTEAAPLRDKVQTLAGKF